MKAFKAFIRPFEAPQRSAKIKIQLNFFSSSGVGTGRVKDTMMINIIFRYTFALNSYPKMDRGQQKLVPYIYCKHTTVWKARIRMLLCFLYALFILLASAKVMSCPERSGQGNLLTCFPAGVCHNQQIVSIYVHVCSKENSSLVHCMSPVYKINGNASPFRLFDVIIPVHRALLKLWIYI